MAQRAAWLFVWLGLLGQGCADHERTLDAAFFPGVIGPDGSQLAEAGAGADSAAATDAGGVTVSDAAAMDADPAAPEASTVDLPGSAEPCPDAEFLDLATVGLPECTLCANAKCVPTALVMASNPDSVDQLAVCGEGDNRCLPNAYVITRGKVKLKTCTSLLGGEGRCMSSCVPLVAAQGDRLPRDTCAEDERCAPCFDPFTGERTAACSVGCTPPATGQPMTFPKCCSDTGACVSPELAGERADQLNADTCSQASGPMLCAPNDIRSDKPVSCRSVNDSEGRCLSRCLNSVKPQEATLPQSSCPATHRCVPCFDPRAVEPTPTGACTLNGDAPVEPARTFAPCCSGGGLCVPAANVPEERRASLAQLDCAAQQLCSPKAAVADQAGGAFRGNPTCTTELSGLAGLLTAPAAGICAPLCFQPAAQPIVGGQPLQGSCASAQQFCAPCIHPTEGTNTGACPSDAGTPSDAGPASDGGSARDAGSASDAGSAADAGSPADASPG
jgi:hypothetical protein